MRGPGDALVQKIGQVISEIDVYICLAVSVVLHLCDLCWCPDFSALGEFEGCKRAAGVELLDFLSHLEILFLRVRGFEDRDRSFIYDTLSLTDPTVVQQLHKHAVRGVRQGEQHYAEIIAHELEIACSNARSLSRTLPEKDRASVVQLTSIAFAQGIVGKDRALSDGAGRSDSRHRENKFRNREKVVAAARELHTNEKTTRVSETSQRPPTQPHMAAISHGADTKNLPTVKQDNPEDRYGVAWKAVQTAGSEPGKSNAYRIAAMIFPTDGDSKRYDSQRERDGFPKATVVFTGEDGKPRLRADKTVDIRYGRGLISSGDPDCRYCAVYAANKANKIDRSTWTEADRDGQHNPRRCKRLVRALLQEGADGAAMLYEYGNRK